MSTKPAAKILIVEDNEANLELFQEILKIGQYRCIHTQDGGDALIMAARELPDLILLDIQLPGMDGLEVLQQLRSTPEIRHIKTIALTAHAMKGDQEMFLQHGFDGYIAKPVKVKGFLEKIRNYLEMQDQPEAPGSGTFHE